MMMPMNEELQVLGLVVRRLEDAGINYMLTGSMALSIYSQPRMTRDVDLVVELRSADAMRISQLFQGEFECDADEIREAIASERMFNLIHVERVVKIDFVIRKSSPYRREEFNRRQRRELDGFEVWVVSPEDLLLSKLAWAKDTESEQQLRDVRGLVAAGKELDWVYLERWAREVGVTELLNQVRP